jgi:hypothetical protein
VSHVGRPSLAAILTLLGGGFILGGGVVLWTLGTGLALVFGLSRSWYFGGFLVGLMVVALAGLMWLAPGTRRVSGAAAIACAAASVPLAFGGFVVGFALTAIGGAIAVARPPPRAVVVPSPSSSEPSPPPT